MSLTPEERQMLLALARETINRVTRELNPPELNLEILPERLREQGASFVTLTRYGQLRGCIGSLEAHRPLALDVRENAVAASLRDPRFPPVVADEAAALSIEVSVLTTPQPLICDGPDDLIAKLRPNVDGVVIQKGSHRSTFLPQVWEQLPDPHEFLRRLCLKGGMSPDAYRLPGLDVFTYQVEEFSEDSD